MSAPAEYAPNLSDPKTAAEAVAAWDAGFPVWSVEMGGIGPGYEQCIQTGIYCCLGILLYTWLLVVDRAIRARQDAEAAQAKADRWFTRAMELEGELGRERFLNRQSRAFDTARAIDGRPLHSVRYATVDALLGPLIEEPS